MGLHWSGNQTTPKSGKMPLQQRFLMQERTVSWLHVLRHGEIAYWINVVKLHSNTKTQSGVDYILCLDKFKAGQTYIEFWNTINCFRVSMTIHVCTHIHNTVMAAANAYCASLYVICIGTMHITIFSMLFTTIQNRHYLKYVGGNEVQRCKVTCLEDTKLEYHLKSHAQDLMPAICTKFSHGGRSHPTLWLRNMKLREICTYK